MIGRESCFGFNFCHGHQNHPKCNQALIGFSRFKFIFAGRTCFQWQRNLMRSIYVSLKVFPLLFRNLTAPFSHSHLFPHIDADSLCSFFQAAENNLLPSALGRVLDSSPTTSKAVTPIVGLDVGCAGSFCSCLIAFCLAFFFLGGVSSKSVGEAGTIACDWRR